MQPIKLSEKLTRLETSPGLGESIEMLELKCIGELKYIGELFRSIEQCFNEFLKISIRSDLLSHEFLSDRNSGAFNTRKSQRHAMA